MERLSVVTFWQSFLVLVPNKWSGEGEGSRVEVRGPSSTVCLSNIALSTGCNLCVCVCGCVCVNAIGCGPFEAESITPPSGSAAILQSSSDTDIQLTSWWRSPSRGQGTCCITLQ